jgi:hypothetical protein
MLHDCVPDVNDSESHRKQYKMAESLLHVQHSGAKLCIYTRKQGVTDEQLQQLWMKHYDNNNR